MYKIKISLVPDIKKEEKFLNEMLIQGCVLERISPINFPPLQLRVYKFNKTKKKLPLGYRVDFKKFDRKDDEIEYLSIFKEAGWELFEKNYADNNLINYYYFYTYETDNTSIYDKETLLKEKNKMYNYTIASSIFLLSICIIIPYYREYLNVISFSTILQLAFPLLLIIIIIISVFSKIKLNK